MPSTLNMLLVVVMILNLLALGHSRIRSIIHLVAFQGVLLGLAPLLIHTHPSIGAFLISLATIFIKGIVIPWMLLRALRDAQIKREVEPLIGFLPSIVLGALATGLALIFATNLPLVAGHKMLLMVPASLATVLVGFILLTTRFKAITQVIGYLVLENGIFIFGLLLIEAMPLIVELGVLLDLVVGIFVISIIVNHINLAFSSLDTRKLFKLKE